MIEKYPVIWDRACEEYKGSLSKRDAWSSIVKELYPLWPSLSKDAQKMILEDVKKRWRSVTDRFIKSQRTVSGSSPPRRVPFSEQLQFILTSRNLRRSGGNIRPETPAVHEGHSQEQALEEEVEELPFCNSPDPQGDRPSSAVSALVCEPGTSFSAVEVAATSSDAVPASGAASSTAGAVSRPTGMGPVSARPVPLRRAAPKKATQPETSATVIQALTSRTLCMIDNSSNQDDLDKYGSFIADRLRSMTRERQHIIMSAFNLLLMSIDVPYNIPPSSAIMRAIINIFNEQSGPSPAPAAASQRFGQATPSYRPNAGEGYNYARPAAPENTGQHAASTSSTMVSQELFSQFGYDPEYHNL